MDEQDLQDEADSTQKATNPKLEFKQLSAGSLISLSSVALAILFIL